MNAQVFSNLYHAAAGVVTDHLVNGLQAATAATDHVAHGLQTAALVGNHLAYAWMASGMFMPPLQALPDPGHQLACLLQPMAAGLVELACTFGLFKIGGRAISERAGEDLIKTGGLIALALVCAGIIFVPASMTAIAHKLGASMLTFAACAA